MYKKITHNIVEEHFDHPIATKIKQSNERKPKGWYVYEYDTKHDSQGHHMDSVIAWAKLSFRLREIIKSIINDYNDIDDLMKQFDVDISNISNLLKENYSEGVATAFYDGAATVFQSLINVIAGLKEGSDVSAAMELLNTNTTEFAQLLDSVNPEKWPKDTVYQKFSLIHQAYINYAKNLINREWNFSIQNADDAFDIIAVCRLDRHSLAYYFASGLGGVM